MSGSSSHSTSYMSLDDTRRLVASDNADLSSAYLHALDMPELSEVREAVEASQICQPGAAPGMAQFTQPRLEPGAELRGLAARTAINRLAARGQRGIDSRSLKQQRMQFRRKAMRILPAQQQETRDVLVDLRLQLEREQRHGTVVFGVVGDAEEVADALDGIPAVGDVSMVERIIRVLRPEPVKQPGIEEQRHAELFVARGDEELFCARRVLAVTGKERPLGD